MTKRFLVSWAQNATPIHQGFFESIQQWCRQTGGHFLVVGGRYKNATSIWSKTQETDEWWTDEVAPYLVGRWESQEHTDRKGKVTKRKVFKSERKRLGKNLELYADISIQPTASRPLSGFEVFVGESHAIFGHPKRAMEVVPTGTRQPRVQWTTSACTLPNYTNSKAGKKGHAHHVIGAVVVEVESDGTFFCRHVSANRDGSFTDLDTFFMPTGSCKAKDALAIVMGDMHWGKHHEPTLEATEALVRLLRPKHLMGHDWLDFSTRNHHDKGLKHQYDKRFDTVEVEVKDACGGTVRCSRWGIDWGMILEIIRSNHDTHFERWLDEHKDERDPVNAPYYHAMWTRAFSKRKDGQWPNLFELEARRHKVSRRSVRFHKLNGKLRIAGIDCAFHGHIGPNGSRGSKLGFAKLGCKVVIGHSHTPGIMDGVWQTGHKSIEDHGYNNNPSTWLRADVIIHADGKRQMVIYVKGRFRGGQLP